MQLQGLVVARILHQEQRQVPPVVRLHEGVEPRPAAARVLHKGQALVHAALGQQYMGQCMVGPGLLEAQLQRMARCALGLAQQMALLIGKGQHAVEVGDIGAVRLGGQRHAQHGRGIAQVEGMVVRELERGQIARVVVDQCFQPLRGQGRVAIGPGLDGGQPLRFAVMGLRQLAAGALQKGPRLLGGLGIFGKQMERGAPGLHQWAGVLRGDVQDAQHAHLAGGKAFCKIVQVGQGGRIAADRVAIQVLLCAHALRSLAQAWGGWGQGFCGPRICSKARDSCSTPRSSKRAPAICRPMGRPAAV